MASSHSTVGHVTPTAISSSSTEQRRLSNSSTSSERRMSDTWDAAKVPPSQFQLRKGSIYSTPNSKDGHVDRGERDKEYWEKLKEKGWLPK
ncbi:hypothetical protein BKA66DRAFT_565964 [Pyrenochaeta sp. MPI-SDFR-AT-0127]|nr:hypothetical protein BKA66DRAFT_565964 [Pyrenochaeta sp. MPI-SDFR-AT-0127]